MTLLKTLGLFFLAVFVIPVAFVTVMTLAGFLLEQGLAYLDLLLTYGPTKPVLWLGYPLVVTYLGIVGVFYALTVGKEGTA